MSENRAIGVFVGYLLAQELSKGMKPIYIGKYRIHHYLLCFGALFTDNEFLQGILFGAAVEDLPDLIDDAISGYHNLSDNLRLAQGKKTHWVTRNR